MWRVHADAAMFPGGVAALLLQSLHPLAMAGVAGHSGYRGDPWGRLQRTSHFLATTTFGTVEDAEATIARVRGIHERVRGKDPRGRAYRASDPHLLRWVHVAEAHSFLTAHQRYALEPLTAARGRHLRRPVGPGRGPARGDRPPDDGGRPRRRPHGLPARARGDRRGAGCRPLPAARPAPAVGGAARLRAHRDRGRRRAARVGAACAAPAARAEPATAVASGAGRLGTRAVRWAMAGVAEERQLAAEGS